MYTKDSTFLFNFYSKLGFAILFLPVQSRITYAGILIFKQPLPTNLLCIYVVFFFNLQNNNSLILDFKDLDLVCPGNGLSPISVTGN